jgi:hypothetical protein
LAVPEYRFQINVNSTDRSTIVLFVLVIRFAFSYTQSRVVPVVGFQINMKTYDGTDITLFSLVVRRYRHFSLVVQRSHTLSSTVLRFALLHSMLGGAALQFSSQYEFFRWCGQYSSQDSGSAWFLLQDTLGGASFWSSQVVMKLVDCLRIVLFGLRGRTRAQT